MVPRFPVYYLVVYINTRQLPRKSLSSAKLGLNTLRYRSILSFLNFELLSVLGKVGFKLDKVGVPDTEVR